MDSITESQMKAIEAEIQSKEDFKKQKLESELRKQIEQEQKLKELETEKLRLSKEIEDGKKREEEFRKKQEEEIKKIREEMEKKEINFQSSKAIVTNINPFAQNQNSTEQLKGQLKENEDLRRQVELESAKQFAKAYGYELR